MAKSRDTIYTATKEVSATTLMLANDTDVLLTALLTPINQAMDEVREAMVKAGHRPHPEDLPTLTFTFEAKGGDYGDQDRQGG